MQKSGLEWLSSDPGAAKDVATLLGRGYGLSGLILRECGHSGDHDDGPFFPACLLVLFHKNGTADLTEDHGTRRP